MLKLNFKPLLNFPPKIVHMWRIWRHILGQGQTPVRCRPITDDIRRVGVVLTTQATLKIRID